MDDERTSDVLENIDRRLTRVEQYLPTLPTRDEMHAAIQAAVAPLPTRDEMRAAIGQQTEQVRREVREEGERSRHYMQVLTEGLRDEIRLLAEGHLALDRRDAAQHAATTARLDGLRLRVSALEGRRPRQRG